MHMPDSKIVLAIAIIIIIILVYFYFRSGRSAKEKATSKRKKQNSNDLDAIASADGKTVNAEDLYDEFHDQFIQGMTMEDFQQQFDDPDGIIYLRLFQLYKLARDTPNANPNNDITVGDYQKVLDEDL